ncbi:YncE family protein [Nitrososphaera viennensis]|uniref:YncE family protein n=2 Tax=Nitrososphaera viennensis TaxID=1034015 RepID=A0A060HTW1_9ARCH|nr:YncE family protein [Nitrososphaera viennensis]AIC16871.1 exported protein of unknown function [Nitrososphaera viennensis EN76]UVS68774.1 YncE family protein [Nitrososphaera viennensis]
MMIPFALVLAVILIAGLAPSNQAAAYAPYSIKLGSPILDVAVNPATNTIYVSHVNSISVINGSSYSLAATIPLDATNDAVGLAVDAPANRLYAAAQDSNQVYVIDTLANRVVEKIPARGWPVGVAVNPETNLVYVANSASGRSESYDFPVEDDLVSVINGTTYRVVADIDVGSRFLSEEGITRDTQGIGVSAPTTISVNPGTNMVYVGGGMSGDIVAVDAYANKVAARIPIEGSHLGSDINLDTNTVYFSNNGRGAIDVIDGSSNTLYYSIERKENGRPFSFPEDVAVNPKTNKLYVADLDSVSIIDPDSRKVIKTIDIGGYKDVAVNPETNLAFVTVRDSSSLVIIDGNTNEMILDPGSYAYEIAAGIGVVSIAVAIFFIKKHKRKSDRA